MAEMPSFTVINKGVPWWMPWVTFFSGGLVGFILALAAIIVRAEFI